jgi:uncharacterized protein (TIGR02118 family)
VATFIALWEKPDDIEAFEDHYRNEHMGLCEKWPGVQSMSVIKVSGTPTGDASHYHLVFTATFASTDDLQAALKSPEMLASGKDAMGLAKRTGARPTFIVGDDF